MFPFVFEISWVYNQIQVVLIHKVEDISVTYACQLSIVLICPWQSCVGCNSICTRLISTYSLTKSFVTLPLFKPFFCSFNSCIRGQIRSCDEFQPAFVSPPASGPFQRRGSGRKGNGDLQHILLSWNYSPGIKVQSWHHEWKDKTQYAAAMKVQDQQISAGCTQISLIASMSTCFEPQRRVAKCKSTGMSEWPCDDTLIETHIPKSRSQFAEARSGHFPLYISESAI